MQVEPQWITYKTDLETSFEFIYRKDFHEMWEVELLERYGFWSLKQAHFMLRLIGFSIVYTGLIKSDWLIQYTLSDKIKLLDPTSRKPISFPYNQFLVVAEKPISETKKGQGRKST
jgi:hypothetical protein